MTRPTFVEGVAVAAAASVGGTVLFAVPTLIFADNSAYRLVVACMGLAYVLYLLARSRERVGRVSVLAVWSSSAVAIWWLAPTLPIYVIVHVGMVWLIRSLYFHASVVSALLDLGINGLSLVAATWSVVQTHSLWPGIWSFFLIQATFVAIPPHWRRRRPIQTTSLDEDRFEAAYRVAETAVRRFHSAR